jgi:cell fate (sporulation/competence/biofilm development) regulator YlbF (YheA/YmcA/DUF963 family)
MDKGFDNEAVRQKTLELCQVLIDQPEFQTTRRQIDAFSADPVVQEEYQALSEEGARLEHMHRSGQPIGQDQIEAFEKRREAFLSNPVACGFLEAQHSMKSVRDSVVQYVTKTFELGRMPDAQDFESCGCGSGCGCH